MVQLQDDVTDGELSPKEALDEFFYLIRECDVAIRKNPETFAGQSVVEVSEMMQTLLYNFYSMYGKAYKGM